MGEQTAHLHRVQVLEFVGGTRLNDQTRQAMIRAPKEVQLQIMQHDSVQGDNSDPNLVLIERLCEAHRERNVVLTRKCEELGEVGELQEVLELERSLVERKVQAELHDKQRRDVQELKDDGWTEETLLSLQFSGAALTKIDLGLVMKVFRFSLPESVYALGMVGYGFVGGHNRGVRRLADILFTFIFQVVIFLAINYFCQIVMIFHLWSSVQEAWSKSDHCVGSPWLRSTCLGIFGVSIISDITESFNMLRWQSFIKETTETQPIVISEDKIVSGFSKRHKLLNLVAIIIPKFVLAVLLGICGSALILTSEGKDIILNTLAANFVLETDELIFNIACSPAVHVQMKQLPELAEVDEVSRLKGIILHMCGPCVIAMPVAGIVLIGLSNAINPEDEIMQTLR